MEVQKKNWFRSYNSFYLVFFIALYLSSGIRVFAQGDLLIFPKRIVFEGRNRVEQITLANTGKDSATYNISFIQYRMTEQGEFEAITEPDSGQRFATPFLRVFPRKVSLAPGESQIVKVQVINTAKMEEGEYRSHLYFRAEKKNKPLGRVDNVEESNTISVKLEAVFGISIATIIRKGVSNTVASISDAEYSVDEASNPFLSFTINRNGNMSTYGDITINYISREKKSYKVAEAKGVAVYTPGTKRKVKMQLHQPESINFNDGKFKVVYAANETKKVIAETEFQF